MQKSNSAQGLFVFGKDLVKNEQYFESLQVFADVKNKYPYSIYAVAAELEIADVHFTQESFVEAQGGYQTFKSLHPKHEKIPYVTFRLAMCFLNQLPDSIDRDLTLAHKAIRYFDEVINSYSNSEYKKLAVENKKKAIKKLSDKELYIARFYLKQEVYSSALGRFERLLKNYPDYSYNGEVLYGAALSAYKSGFEEKTKDYYLKLTSRHPGSVFAEKAKKEIDKNVTR